MKEIKIFVIHNNIHSVDDFILYYGLESLKDDFDFRWVEKNPDYLIVSEHIYLHKNCHDLFCEKFLNKRIVKIFFCAELYMPDFNMFDYVLGFSDEIKCGDRYTQLSTPDIFYSEFLQYKKNNINETEVKNILAKKRGFCNFLYSNPNAHENRDKFFHLLCKYKKVDSLGKWLNNTNTRATGFGGHQNECVGIKSPYKFSIAFENGMCSGYTTEKILTSLNAHTVPIYWGDPSISKFINPKCFINCFDFENFDAVKKKVEEIDSNDELWKEMVLQPWQTESQIQYTSERNKRYLDFWNNIFSQDYNMCFRVPEGYHPENYKILFKSTKAIFDVSMVKKVYKKLLSIVNYGNK